jgi:hypothetical protein
VTAAEALRFVRDHGVVLVAAKGPAPRLVEAIAGAPIKGSWWAHPQGREIFAVLQQLEDSHDILVCRLVNGNVTLVHRRLWPALVRMAAYFNAKRLAQVRQEHTASGRHVNHETAFPKWVPQEILEASQVLSEAQARRMLGPLVDYAVAPGRSKSKALCPNRRDRARGR